MQKFLANAGIASRRKAEQLILEGKVIVNGVITTELGTKINPAKDVVKVKGQPVKAAEQKVYYMLNKPSGYITTVKDQFNRPSVMTILADIHERIYPIGRLDYETEGLLLLTNDGDLAYKLTHPSKKVDKTYQVLIDGEITDLSLDKLRKGVALDDGVTAPAQASVLKKWPHQTLLELIIHEGKNRQVRRMLDAVGHKVKYLKRVKIGPIALKNLAVGQYRALSQREITILQNL
ncbi:MAG: pseudouridine synthase [Bacillota bacterium]|nr:pseudouridine synthase [Bacillota bacterium]